MSRAIGSWVVPIIGTVVATLVGISATVLYQDYGLPSLVAIWLAVATAIAILIVATFAVETRSMKRMKVVRDYRIETESGLVYRVYMKVEDKREEPWPDVSGPFCPEDLSRMNLVPDGLEVPFFTDVARHWVCPLGDRAIPWDPEIGKSVKGVAVGKWNRGEPSNWTPQTAR